jgi:hypothetical protein
LDAGFRDHAHDGLCDVDGQTLRRRPEARPRFRRDADELIRGMKKDADRFIAHAKESIAADELDEDES